MNISSVFGLLGIPTQSAYNSAKFAVRGFTDALRTELDIEQCGVSATTIHPGGIRTNIARNARFEFADYEAEARAMGFAWVKAGPLVRSSYYAEEIQNAQATPA